MKSADGTDIGHRLAFKYVDYLEYLGGSNGIISVLKEKEGAEEERRCGWKNGSDVASFGGGGKGP